MLESPEIKNNIDEYLIQGEQSQLTESDNNFIESTINFNPNNPCDSIYKWKEEIFFLRNKGMGPYIGENTMSKIIEKKVLQGCHDDALICATVLRKYGIPCKMIETVNIQHMQGKQGLYKGHVFLKVYLNGQRKIYDASHNEFVQQDKQGLIQSQFYSIAEGQDSREYGIYNHDDLHTLIDNNKYNIRKIKIKRKITDKIFSLFRK